MESKLERLSLDTQSRAGEASRKSRSKVPVADSWDEESATGSDTEVEASSTADKSSIPSVPPPTPISSSGFPSWETAAGTASPTYSALSGGRGDEEKRRPEKSTAVAGRLIAGALGVKAPKKTEEQRAYERAVKEQEIKKKNREKAAKEKEKEEAENAKNAIWDG